LGEQQKNIRKTFNISLFKIPKLQNLLLNKSSQHGSLAMFFFLFLFLFLLLFLIELGIWLSFSLPIRKEKGGDDLKNEKGVGFLTIDQNKQKQCENNYKTWEIGQTSDLILSNGCARRFQK
jgi:hypothetical protein